MATKTRLNLPVWREETRVKFQCRLSYVHLDKPHKATDEAKPKYQVTCLVPKTDKETVEALKAAFLQARQNGIASKWGGRTPTEIKKPFKDGDDRNDVDEFKYPEEFRGCIFLNAASDRPVFTCNRSREEITPDQVYSGCYALVSVNLYPYDAGSKGVAAGLNAVMKTFDGERLGGYGDGRRDFDDLDIPEEDEVDIDDL